MAQRNRKEQTGVHKQPSGFRSLFRGSPRKAARTWLVFPLRLSNSRDQLPPRHMRNCCMWCLPYLSSVTASETEAAFHHPVCSHHPNRHCASTACMRIVCRLNSHLMDWHQQNVQCSCDERLSGQAKKNKWARAHIPWALFASGDNLTLILHL